MLIGTSAEYEALKKAVADANEKAAAEQVLHEKHEARVIAAERELQEAVKKSEGLEQSLTEKEFKLARAHQAARDAQGETQGAQQEIQEARTIAAGKAFFHVKRVFEDKIMFLTLSSDFSRGICGTAPQHIRCCPILPD